MPLFNKSPGNTQKNTVIVLVTFVVLATLIFRTFSKRVRSEDASAEAAILIIIAAAILRHTINLQTPHEPIELNWEDVLWLHENCIGLRNVGKKKGDRERKEGGDGSAYSLANLGLNPGQRDIPVLKDNEEEKLMHRIYTPNSGGFPSCFLLKMTQLPNIQKAFTKKLNQHLLTIVKNCLSFPFLIKNKNDENMFHLIKGESTHSYEYSELYPTG